MSDEAPVRPAPPANQALLAILGNLIFESQQHTIWLRQIYDDLKAAEHPAEQVFGSKMLLEFERHHAAQGTGVEALRAYVQSGAQGGSTPPLAGPAGGE